MNGTAARFLHSTWGAIVALGSAAAVGAASALWLSGLTGLPGEVATLKKQMERAIALQEWIVCTTVPPNRRDVLAALQITCEYNNEGAVERAEEAVQE